LKDGHRAETLSIKKYFPHAQSLLFSASYDEKTYEFAKKLCTKKVGGQEVGKCSSFCFVEAGF
jgi:hypothetical protein